MAKKDIRIWSKKFKFSKEPDDKIFRSFVEQSAEGICLIDNEGVIIEWNQAMSDIYRVPRKKYLNKPVWLFDYDFLPKKIKTKKEKSRLKDSVLTSVKNPGEGVFISEVEKEIEGQTRFIQYRIFPIQIKNKEGGILLIIQNIAVHYPAC